MDRGTIVLIFAIALLNCMFSAFRIVVGESAVANADVWAPWAARFVRFIELVVAAWIIVQTGRVLF